MIFPHLQACYYFINGDTISLSDTLRDGREQPGEMVIADEVMWRERMMRGKTMLSRRKMKEMKDWERKMKKYVAGREENMMIKRAGSACLKQMKYFKQKEKRNNMRACVCREGVEIEEEERGQASRDLENDFVKFSARLK